MAEPAGRNAGTLVVHGAIQVGKQEDVAGRQGDTGAVMVFPKKTGALIFGAAGQADLAERRRF
ncbi:hypothetical protein NB636_06045 [Oxalobacter aliiformigenes]|uniref:hypothetical protein n=1 Tax=Oxalobacter aliiformigenes TaxID=2946593 RepID=UPI0022AFAB28|nr:hypothetical protein [Oxalobacter aliiformigenes]MCZ4065141.1 hypothetical protein [Oxalobacter aliiformigenes]WAV98308.1 hypothetical protein NB636_06045 [Oxalobacter aliiformigenes]